VLLAIAASLIARFGTAQRMPLLMIGAAKDCSMKVSKSKKYLCNIERIGPKAQIKDQRIICMYSTP
jgi:hypothetical protein